MLLDIIRPLFAHNPDVVVGFGLAVVCVVTILAGCIREYVRYERDITRRVAADRARRAGTPVVRGTVVAVRTHRRAA